MKAARRELTQGDYRLFRRLVEEKSGIDVPLARRPHLEQAVARALDRSDLQSPSALYHRLSSADAHAELEEFVASLTVGETHFFRNKPQFEALERHVLPDLIRLRSEEKRLRIWSAGCSSGEEPYSLAMLLDRTLPDIDTWNISILGTDIDPQALKRAHRAVYRAWSFREVPPDIRSRYFTRRDDDDLELVPRIRQMVAFEYLNLVEDAYPSLLNNTNAVDLVVCRNVLIYFRDEAARSVVARLHRSMAEQAWLLMGHAEPSQWLKDWFSMQTFPGAVAYRKGGEKAPAPGVGKHRARGDRHPRRRPVPRIRRSIQRPPSVRRADPTRTSRDPAPALAPDERCEQALALWDSGDALVALKELESLTEEFADDPRPPYLAAKIHAGRLEVEISEDWCRRSIERDPLFAPAYHLLGVVAAEDGRPDDAIAAFRRCVYAHPDWPLGHFALAEALFRRDEQRRARAALKAAEDLLEEVPSGQEIAEGEGLTAGRLRELAAIQREIFGSAAPSRGDR